MPAKIRLQRHGRRKRPFYHIVVADARAPRDGRFIEKLGTYNPMTKPATIDIDRDKAFDWLMKGAQPTDTTRAILRFKGILYRKHLARGVKKGAVTEEQASKMYLDWITEKEGKIEARRQETLQEKAAQLAALSGTVKKVERKAEVVEEHKPAEVDNKSFADSVEQTTIETVAATEEAPAEVAEAPAPVVEEAAAPVVEEAAPAAVEEVAAPAVEAVVEAAPAVEAAAPAAADDLKKIEGIGPKVAEILTENGIATFAALADTAAEKIKGILSEKGGTYAAMDPTTWPAQSKMAAEGKWDELKKWQNELDGGKPPA